MTQASCFFRRPSSVVCRLVVKASLFAGLLAACANGRAAEAPKDAYVPISKEAFDRWAADLYDGGRPKTYTGKCLSYVALPLGGIGSGSLAINGEGRLMEWQIFNNFNIGTQINDCFFAVWAKPEGGEPVARLLQTAKLADLPLIEGLSFVGEYPFGWFTYRDAKLPVQVSLEAFNPMIPLNPKDSAYPAAVFTFTVKNPTDKPCEVSLLATLQNAVGFTGQGGYGGTSYGGFMKNRNQLKAPKRPPEGGTTNEGDGLTVLSLGAEPGEPGLVRQARPPLHHRRRIRGRLLQEPHARPPRRPLGPAQRRRPRARTTHSHLD